MNSLNLAACTGIILVSLVGFIACGDASPPAELDADKSTQFSEVRAAYKQDQFTSLVRLFLRALVSTDPTPQESTWIVSGRVMFGNKWHIISTTPANFDQSREAFNGLHATFSKVPHQLSLVSLSNCAELAVFTAPDGSQIPLR